MDQEKYKSKLLTEFKQALERDIKRIASEIDADKPRMKTFIQHTPIESMESVFFVAIDYQDMDETIDTLIKEYNEDERDIARCIMEGYKATEIIQAKKIPLAKYQKVRKKLSKQLYAKVYPTIEDEI